MNEEEFSKLKKGIENNQLCITKLKTEFDSHLSTLSKTRLAKQKKAHIRRKWLFSTFAFVIIALVSSYLYFSRSYKHEFAVCAMFKNEAPYLKEWIDYHHHVLGATRFYLYNNDSTDDYQSVLNPYIEQGLVELIQWETCEKHAIRGWKPEVLEPWVDFQVGAYTDCFNNRALGKVRWVAVVDIDEYIVPTHGVKSFKSLLKKKGQPWSLTGSIGISWKLFGTSNIWDISDKDLLIEKLYFRANDNHGGKREVKSIHRPEAVDVCLVHKAKLHKKYKSTKVSKKEFNIHHYWTGPEKRLMEKRGVSKEGLATLSEQYNCVEDRTIFQYLKQLKQSR